MIKIYVLPRVPGAENTSEWTSFCHSKEPFIVIDYDTLRSISRWDCVPRVRKFNVAKYNKSRHGLYRQNIGYYSTLESAQKAANSWAN
jgi:hypothetical protein